MGDNRTAPSDTDDSSDYTDTAAADWQRLRGDLDLSRYLVGMRMMRLATVLQATLDRALEETGFTVLGDYNVMSVLRRTESPVLPSELAGALRLTRAGITGRLDRLEAAGFVKRERSSEDSRNVFISLTAKGRRATDRAFDRVVASEDEMFRDLSADEIDQLADLLRRIGVRHDPSD